MDGPDDWAEQVLLALRAYFAEDRYLLTPTRLVEAHLTSDPDGTPVLVATYDHPYYDRRIGLRRKLLQYPVPEGTGWDPNALAEDIARYDISEPLGRYAELLVEDGDGVWWWGDGYPELTKDPNAPWYADLPRGRWRRVAEPWTVADRNAAACKSVAAADGEVLENPTILMPPRPVHCIRPEGHGGLHGSASRSKEADGADLEIFAWDER
jgi:hypothetical protein